MAIGSIQAGVAAAQSAMPQRSQQLGQSIQDASATAAAAFAGIMERKQAEEDRIDQTRGALKQSYYGGERVTEDSMYDGHYKVLDAMGNALISDEMISWAAENSENQSTWLGMLSDYQQKVASAENLYKTTNKEYQTAMASASNPVELANLDKDGFQIDSGAAESFLNQQFLALHEDVAGKDSQVQIDIEDLKNGKLNFTVATLTDTIDPNLVGPLPVDTTFIDDPSLSGPTPYIGGIKAVKYDTQDLGAFSFEKEENLTAFNLVRSGLITEKPPVTIAGAVQSNSLGVDGQLTGAKLEANIAGAMENNEYEVLNWYFNSGEVEGKNKHTREEINRILQDKGNEPNKTYVENAKKAFSEAYKEEYIKQEPTRTTSTKTQTSVSRRLNQMTGGGRRPDHYVPSPYEDSTKVRISVGGVDQFVSIVDVDFSDPDNVKVTYNDGSTNVQKTASELGGLEYLINNIRSSIMRSGDKYDNTLKAFDQLVEKNLSGNPLDI